MKNILLTNDDGISSPGIDALARSLSKVANVYIVAPRSQMSCSSHGLTTRDAINIREEENPYAKKAFSITGYPADCVRMGRTYLENEEGVHIDYIFSGINMGPNVGTDVVYSGTVAAAVEGGIIGVSSVAVSIDSYVPTDFEYAAELAVLVFETMEKDERRTWIINLNVPDLPKERVQGIKISAMGHRVYKESYKLEDRDDGTRDFTYTGVLEERNDKDEPEQDVVALREGYATITPIKYLWTDEEAREEILKLNKGKMGSG